LKKTVDRRFATLLVVASLTLAVACARTGDTPQPAPPEEAAAETTEVPLADPNERYKTAEGRQLAIADFEQPEREDYQMTAEIMGALDLQAGMVVADVGAGTGYFSREFAVRVAPGGKVLAVDVVKDFLDDLERRAAEAGIDNIETILSAEDDPMLPVDSVDLVFAGDAYHHFLDPTPMLEGMRASLRPGGRLAIVDWKRQANPAFEESGLNWEEHIRLGEQGTIDEITAHGFRLVEKHDFLEWQFFLVFEVDAS
jgi:SAM-dependent methyltransferase